MRIALAHNYYQNPGGEDTLFHNARDLFLANGHQVFEFKKHNDEIKEYSLLEKAGLTGKTVYNNSIIPEMTGFIKSCRPDVVQFFNIFPLISPAAYYACRAMNVPVVQSLDNARLICPNASFYRNGKDCTDCLGKTFAWPGVLHGCYKSSRLKTAVVAAMSSFNRRHKTWHNYVDKYIVATDYYRKIFIQAGFPAEKIIVKPHFVLPENGVLRSGPGKYALFVGRLSKEKGIITLLKAWKKVSGMPLRIRGEGPLLHEVREFIRKENLDCVDIVGRLSREELTKLISQAKFLILPSEGIYETFGLVTIEAFACGVPVISSVAGVAPEIVTNGKTGLLFKTGDPEDLAAKVRWVLAHEQEMEEMGRRARREYEAKYTPERNHLHFMEIYQDVINKA